MPQSALPAVSCNFLENYVCRHAVRHRFGVTPPAHEVEWACLFQAAALGEQRSGIVIVTGRLPCPADRLAAKLSETGRALVVVADAAHFPSQALPGAGTLVAPRNPEIAARAVLSAAAVVSGNLAAAIAAAANGIPCALLSDDVGDLSRARALAIPCLDATPGTRVESIRQWIAEALAHYPHDDVQVRLRALQARVERRLRSAGLEPAGRTSNDCDSRLVDIACISDVRYLAQLRGLLRNVREIERGPVRFHVLALDDEAEAVLRAMSSPDSVTVYRLGDLWSGADLTAMRRRNMPHRAYASKPRLLSKAIESSGRPVIYVDTDIYFERPPCRLLRQLGESRLLLFPNFNDKLEDCRTYGVFNAGIVAASPLAQAPLDWWARLCVSEYRESPDDGYFVDQGFLDLLPAYFEGIGVYRTPDENIARWNLDTAAQYIDAGAIGSIHAAQADPLGLFEKKLVWDQATAFFSDPAWRGDPQLADEQAVLVQRGHALPLSRLERASRALAVPGVRLRVTSPAWARFFLRGPGRAALSLAATLHRTFRRLAQRRLPLSPPSTWPKLQRAVIPQPAADVMAPVASRQQHDVSAVVERGGSEPAHPVI